MQSSATAESDQGEITRIVPALDRNQADGPLHIGVSHAHDTGGGGNAIDPERAGDRVDGPRRPLDVETHFATHELIGGDAAQDHVRVRYGRPVAHAVTGRSPTRPRPLPAHPRSEEHTSEIPA